MSANSDAVEGSSGGRRDPVRVGRRRGLLPGGIRARLFLLIALSLVPALLLLGWVYYQRYQARRADALQAELEVAQGVATTLGAYLNDLRRTCYTIGQAILTFDNYTQAKATAVLQSAESQYPTMRALGWATPEGRVVASSAAALLGRDLSIRPYFRQVRAGRPWAIGDLTPTGVDAPVPTAGLAVAARDGSGALRGVVVAVIDPTRLGDLTLTQTRPGGGVYAVFDRQGVLVYRNPELALTWAQRIRWRETDPVLRRALRTGRAQVGRVPLEVPGGEWISARVPIGEIGWVAGAGRPVEIAFGPVWRGLILDSILALVVLGLALALAGIVARTISAPLRRLGHDAQAMGAGELVAADDPQAPLEVRRLRDTVTRMATGLVRRAEALRESESRLNTIVESLAEGLVVSDTQGNLVHWNRAALEMHGFVNREQVERHLHEFATLFELSEVNGEVVPYDRWPVARILCGETLRDWELRIRRLHDADWQRIYSYGGTLVHDADGRPLMAVLTITDVTERRRAEEQLRRSQAMLAEAERLSHTGAWEWDVVSGQWSFSDEWLAIHGVARPTLTPDELLVIAHPDDREAVAQAMEGVRTGTRSYEMDHRIIRMDTGEVRTVRARGQYARDAAGKVVRVFGFAQDITKQKQAEEEIRRLNAELEQRVIERTAQLRQRATELEAANKELEAFSYSVSHDLRTPLRSIDGFSKILLEDYSAIVDETGQDYLQRVRAAAQRMGQLIDDILQLSRATRVEMRRGPVDLSAIAEDVIAELRRSAPERQAEVTIEPGMVAEGDASLLRIVLQNLLGNAWKFTRDRTPARIEFTAGTRDGERAYCVRDNGAGFDMAYAHKLFGAFQRLHTEAEFPGTGIGLALVQRIIRRHGGRVWAEGAVGQGATFCFTLGEKTE